MSFRGPWIVAGMHRSGTSLVASSLVASALAEAGIDMGARLLPPDELNRPGYFEDLDFLDLDRRMLAAATREDDGGHPDWGWTESEHLDTRAFAGFADEARRLVAARRAGARPWGFKHPRATLLLDFWLHHLPEARFVLPYRLPWEVGDSLQRLGAEVFSRRPDYGWRIWAFYNRFLLDFHRRHSERSFLFAVDAAIVAPDRFAELLRARLDLRLAPATLASRFEAALFHRFPADDPLIPLVAAANPAGMEVLAALEREAELPAAGLWRAGEPRAPRPEGAPAVSVVVPCHDDGELLLEAVASVERAIEPCHEVVLVDDGSRQPRTLEILALLSRAGYAVLRQPHSGLAAARNRGFAAAGAPVVIALDADNRLLPGFVAPALAHLASEPRTAAVYGDRIEFGSRRGRVAVGALDPLRLVAGNSIDACAVIRVQAWQECGGYDAEMPSQGWEDWDLWLAMVAPWMAPALAAPAGVRLPCAAGVDAARPRAVTRPAAAPRLRAGQAPRPGRQLVERRFPAPDRQGAGDCRPHRPSEGGRGRARRRSVGGGRPAAAAGGGRCGGRRRRGSDRPAHERAAVSDAARGRSRAAARRLGDQQPPAPHPPRAVAQRHERARGDAGPAAAALDRAPALPPRAASAEGAGASVRDRRHGGIGNAGLRPPRHARRVGDRQRNEFEDALPIERFLDRWLIPYWESAAQPPHPAPPGMDEEFATALDEQFAGDHPGGRGWKSPRSLYLLPFLAQRLPALRFLHVVRDGRDMALSANQLQLARYGSLLLSAEERDRPLPERSITLWARINLWAADIGGRLGDAYLRVRWEDLCARPAEVTRRVFRFFDLPGDPETAARLVGTPPTLGRWRGAEPDLVARLGEIGGEALAAFGYSPGGESAPDQ